MPIYVAASGPLAAKLAGRVGDGFICTSAARTRELYAELLDERRGGRRAGRPRPRAIARMIEIKVSYDRDREARSTRPAPGGRRSR